MATSPASSTVSGSGSGADTKTGAATQTAAPAVDPAAAAAALKEAQAAASIGAQVILDFNDDTSKGARGGAGATMEENTAARDAGLIGLGLDPVN